MLLGINFNERVPSIKAFNLINVCIFDEDISILNNLPINLTSLATSFVGYGKLMAFRLPKTVDIVFINVMTKENTIDNDYR